MIALQVFNSIIDVMYLKRVWTFKASSYKQYENVLLIFGTSVMLISNAPTNQYKNTLPVDSCPCFLIQTDLTQATFPYVFTVSHWYISNIKPKPLELLRLVITDLLCQQLLSPDYNIMVLRTWVSFLLLCNYSPANLEGKVMDNLAMPVSSRSVCWIGHLSM